MTGMMRSLYRRLRGKKTAIVPHDEALHTQVNKFWRTWFQTKGDQWPDDYRRRMDSTTPLQPELQEIVARINKPQIDILDVGAGPVTVLGKTSPGCTIRIVPTDVVASEYKSLLDEFKVNIPVTTIFADAEKLVQQFGPNSFDIVHAQNTVDHMEQPVLAIDQMIECCRPGGSVFLRHYENEGKNTGYAQLHHWDFYIDDKTGDFHADHVHGKNFNVTEHTNKWGKSRTYRVEKRFVWEFTKNS
jgi:SAM-dependent methyltransferase